MSLKVSLTNHYSALPHSAASKMSGRWNSLIYLAICTATFQKWFAVSPLIRLSIVGFFFLGAIGLARRFGARSHFGTRARTDAAALYAIISLLTLYIGANTLLNYGKINIIHPAIYAVLFFWTAIVLPIAMREFNYKFGFFLVYMVGSVAFIADFLTTNILHWSLAKYFQFITIPGFFDPYIRFAFISPSGPAEEPGDMAFYLCLMLPFAIQYVGARYKSSGVIALLLLHVTCLVLLFSTASIALWPISFFLAVFVALILGGTPRARILDYFTSRRSISMLLGVAVVAAVIWPAYSAVRDGQQTTQMIGVLFEKMAFSERSVSASMRRRDLDLSTAAFQESPVFGKGLGYFSEEVGHVPQNFYAMLAAELGVVGVCLYMAFISISLWSGRDSFAHTWALVYGALHMTLISDVWNVAYLYAIASALALMWSPREVEDNGRSRARGSGATSSSGTFATR